MSDECPLPVLWIYGPPGVGKTTIGFRLFERMDHGGYVDIDQLGICYGPPTPEDAAPEPPEDPGRHRLKTRNLDAVVVNHRAAGARFLIVSGIVDAERGVERELLPHADVRTLRLRADPAELRRRLEKRGRPGEDVRQQLAYAEALDRSDDACVDTTGRTPAEVLDEVVARLGGWPGTGDVIWIFGVPGVGKSTVGWQVYERIRQSGVHAAFIDLEQIGFRRPDTGDHRLEAANVAALWRTFRAAGAQKLVVVGDLDSAEAARASPGSPRFRLYAGRETLLTRILDRGNGIGALDLAGDRFLGRPEAFLREAADRAHARAEALDKDQAGIRIDTDGRAPAEIADEIIDRAGAPPPRTYRRACC